MKTIFHLHFTKSICKPSTSLFQSKIENVLKITNEILYQHLEQSVQWKKTVFIVDEGHYGFNFREPEETACHKNTSSTIWQWERENMKRKDQLRID